MFSYKSESESKSEKLMPALDSTNVWEDKHILTKEKKRRKSQTFQGLGGKT